MEIEKPTQLTHLKNPGNGGGTDPSLATQSATQSATPTRPTTTTLRTTTTTRNATG